MTGYFNEVLPSVEYFGQTASQVGQLLAQNKAMLTDFNAYVDTDNNVKFVVVMAPANQTWWWAYGNLAYIGQQMTQNKARLTALSPCAVPPPEMSWNFGTGSGTTSSGATECAYALNLTLKADGTCHFWGSYTNRGDVPIITAVFPVNSDLADTVGVEHWPTILSYGRVVGIACRNAVAFPNSSGIAA